jgi:hypothetical protein
MVWNDRQRGVQERFDMPESPNAQIIKKVKNLSEIADALRRGKYFTITRLTTIKSLCVAPEAAAAFGFFWLRKFRTRCLWHTCRRARTE